MPPKFDPTEIKLGTFVVNFKIVIFYMALKIGVKFVLSELFINVFYVLQYIYDALVVKSVLLHLWPPKLVHLVW